MYICMCIYIYTSGKGWVWQREDHKCICQSLQSGIGLPWIYRLDSNVICNATNPSSIQLDDASRT